jgi:hypothetical protein
VIGHVGSGGGWDRHLQFLLYEMRERLESIERRVSAARTAANKRAQRALAVKALKAAERRSVDDKAALDILHNERTRQAHGYLKRASRLTGLSVKQLQRLRHKKSKPELK